LTTIVPVALWCPASCRRPLEAALTPLAAHLRPRFHLEEATLRGLPAALAADAGQPCVVVWAGLDAHLAEHLAIPQGADAGEAQVVAAALAAWQEWAEALLAAFARARRRVVLLPAAAVLAAPGGVAAALAARLGLPATGLSAAPAAPAAVLPPDLPAHAALMAAAVLQTAPAARALQDRLEAASLPVAGFSLARAQGAAGLAAVLATQVRRDQALRDAGLDAHRADLAAGVAKAEAARALIAEALAAQTDMTDRLVRTEVEARAEARTLAARLTELTRTLAETEVALAREAATARDAAETARRLQDRLVQGEAERAALEAQIAALEAGRTGIEAERAALETQVAALENGRTGIEAELRARAAEIAALAEEARQRAALIGRQRSELQTETARRAEVEALRDALLASTSWRITAPLRRVVLMLRRLRG